MTCNDVCACCNNLWRMEEGRGSGEKEVGDLRDALWHVKHVPASLAAGVLLQSPQWM